MSNYSITGSPIGAFDISTVELGGTYNKKFPNKKISMSIHEAHGGYIVEIDNLFGKDNDLYIVAEGQDLGVEISKIITHNILKKHESTNSQTSR